MIRFTLAISILFFLLSCGNEKKKDIFNDSNFVETFGVSKRVPLGNSGFSIELPSTHYIEEIKGKGFVEFDVKSTDTTYNKGKGIIRFNLIADEKDESMVKDTNVVYDKYDSLKDYHNLQIFKWTENESNQVESFNLATVMNSLHK